MRNYQVAYTFKGPDEVVRQNVIEAVSADSAPHAIEIVRAQFARDLPKSKITYIKAQRNAVAPALSARSTPFARR